MSLIIVESPTKARTFNRIFQGKDYFVFATMGHFRDLPENKLAIKYQENFKPEYEIIESKKKIVEKIIDLAKKNKEVIIATDPDREGESIGYHVAFVLGKVEENWPEIKLKEKELKRIIFHEITEEAINEALKNPQTIRLDLVKAQISRRILDRIVGYELSPILWEKIGKNWLSAGRVQTVALRIVVEREKEIKNFKQEEYYQIYGSFDFDENLKAKLISKNNIDYENKITLNLFAGNYQYTKTTINENNLESIKKDILNDEFFIEEINEETQKKYPPPPFTTSLLQQEAFNRFGFSSKLTMNLAQSLYENGLITYHRTDSFNLSSYFIFKARDYIKKQYGENYLSEKPRMYKTKNKLAQEAHEAIRPTKLEKNTKIKQMSENHKKLYQLIFERAIATQMREVEYKVIKIKIKSKKGYLFEIKKEKITFDGFLKIYKKNNNLNNNNIDLKVKINQKTKLLSLQEEKNITNPPYRYTEASLIKTLEEKGIGRPSTYASIISLIQSKNYVEKQGRYLLPTNLGTAISDYLSSQFPQIFNLDFTALMEDDLDRIANSEKQMIEVLKEFYLKFSKLLTEAKKNPQKIEIDENVGICPKCQSKLIIKKSKFGKFIACARYPQCDYKQSLLKKVSGKKCPKCGGDIIIKYTKSKKKFFGCSNYPTCNFMSWSLKNII